jgi:hypothetical protein
MSGRVQERATPAPQAVADDRSAPAKRSGRPALTGAALDAEIADLACLGLEELRARWRVAFGPPPKLRSAELMRLMLAWRLQARAYGGLDAGTRQRLVRRGPVAPAGRALGIGARLTRDWEGEKIEVIVTAEGFSWKGACYKSLSALASTITGTRWNGPRFFGLTGVRS